MHKNYVLFLTLICAIIGGALYYVGDLFYFYWTYWWFDVLMHFFVSFTGGLGIFWGLFDSGFIFRERFEKRGASILLVFACVFSVGIGWEVFEYAYGINDSNEGYVLDTIDDLILDSAGAIIAAALVSRRKNHG